MWLLICFNYIIIETFFSLIHTHTHSLSRSLFFLSHIHTHSLTHPLTEAAPSDAERDVHTQVHSVLVKAPEIIEELKTYKGAGEKIREVGPAYHSMHTHSHQ